MRHARSTSATIGRGSERTQDDAAGPAGHARRSAPRGRRLTLGLLVTVMGVLGLSACSDGARSSGSGKPLVVATTTQLADFARQVGGDHVEVYGLLRPNLDAHDFEPSPADLDALARADVIVENGLGLEPWLHDAVTASGTDTQVTDTSVGAHLITGDSASTTGNDHEGETDGAGASGHDHGHDGEANPHIWFDPHNAQVMVGHVTNALTAAVPSAATDIEARAERYDAELAELDAWIAAQLGDLEDKDMVTDHNAFVYFFDRYGLTFVGSVIPSFDSSAELSASDMQELLDRIDAEGVKAIFTERSLPPKAAKALARRAGVEVVTGDDGLYGDSLGPEGSDAATYVSMMRHNTTSIVTHLS